MAEPGGLWSNPGPDSGWSWVVAFACLMVNLYTNGFLRLQGLLFLATLDTYQVSRELASWPFSLFIASACFSGLLVPILMLLLSPRQLLLITGFLVFLGQSLCFFADTSGVLWITICYGIISGMGVGLVTPTLAVITNQYFLNNRTTANGIALSGITMGAFVFPSATNALLDEYGLQGTFLILGALALNVWVAASLIRPRVKKQFPSLAPIRDDSQKPLITKDGNPIKLVSESKENDKVKACNDGYAEINDSTAVGHVTVKIRLPQQDNPDDSPFLKTLFSHFRDTVTDPMFTVVALSALSSIMVLFIFIMIIVDHAIEIGIPKEKASMLLPVFSLPDLIGRLTTGWVSDKGFVGRKYVFMTAKTLSGVLLLVLPVITTTAPLFLFTGILGVLEGSATILTGVLFVDYLGLQRLAMAMGLWSFSIGIVFLATPPMIGLFKDNYGQYDNIFYLMGGISVISASLWILEPPIMKQRRLKTLAVRQ